MRSSNLFKLLVMISHLSNIFTFKFSSKIVTRKGFSLQMSAAITSQKYGGARGILHQRMEKALTTAFGEGVVTNTDGLIMPTQPVHGDYQCNVALTLTKKLGMKPKDIAEKIMNALEVQDVISTVNITGPGFISMRLSDAYVSSQLSNKIDDSKRLGIEPVKTPQKIIVDFSSPNIAKEMHVGHLRSTILGDSLSRILEFLGHNVLRLNHVGDWGTQFGMLIHYLKTKYPEQIKKSSIDNNDIDLQLSVSDLMKYYKEAKKVFDEDPIFKETARNEVVKLQNGDPDSLLVWKAICDKSRIEFNKIYNMLNIQLTERGESFYNPYLAPLVQDLKEKKIVSESQGSQCLFIPGDKYKTPEGDPLPIIIQKSDGGFLYATTDMAAAVHRATVEKANRILYVTDVGQSQHFNMIFDAIKAYNIIDNKIELHHVPFGLVLGEDGKKIKTRSGESVRLKELLDEAILNAQKDMESRKQKDITEDKNTSENTDNTSSKISTMTEEDKEIAAKVGLAAVKYADLSMNRLSDYRFSFNRMLSLTGNTAPYMLYAYVRIRGIQRKAELQAINTQESTSNTNKILLNTPEEMTLGKQLLKLEEVLLEVSYDYCPNKLCDYLFELSQKFNSFYESCPVLKAETTELQQSRIALCSLTADTLKLSLALLGIETVEKL